MSISPPRLIKLVALSTAALLLVAGLSCSDDRPDPAVAATPEELSTQLISNDQALRAGIDGWRSTGDPPSGPAPEEVMVQAAFLQESVRLLAARPALASGAIALLPPELAGQISQMTSAARSLRKLAGGGKPRKLKTGEPPSVAELVGHYGAAKRLGIHLHYLAAIHHVETKFGRVKSDSVAGAKGPMQFIPSTWKIYGRGGNIQDPHDAILAAARLLRANGAPRSYGRALYHYNPSKLYVSAVSRYAKLIARDPYALYYLYCWMP